MKSISRQWALLGKMFAEVSEARLLLRRIKEEQTEEALDLKDNAAQLKRYINHRLQVRVVEVWREMLAVEEVEVALPPPLARVLARIEREHEPDDQEHEPGPVN